MTWVSSNLKLWHRINRTYYLLYLLIITCNFVLSFELKRNLVRALNHFKHTEKHRAKWKMWFFFFGWNRLKLRTQKWATKRGTLWLAISMWPKFTLKRETLQSCLGLKSYEKLHNQIFGGIKKGWQSGSSSFDFLGPNPKKLNRMYEVACEY